MPTESTIQRALRRVATAAERVVEDPTPGDPIRSTYDDALREELRLAIEDPAIQALLRGDDVHFIPGSTAEALVRRAVKNARWMLGDIRWAAVQRVFGTGSTSAIELCKVAGINPHEYKTRVRPPPRAQNRRPKS